MKLAEALILRADLQKRVQQLRERLQLNALVQEGEQPSENPQELLSELDRLLTQLGALIIRINRTNIQTVFSEQMTLTDALAQRDIITMQHEIINQLANTASTRLDRYGRSEIRNIATVDVAELRRQIDRLAQQRRELDTTIQAKNWATDLL